MSLNNSAAAIGLANTVRIPSIGVFVQDTLQPTADGPYMGIGPGVWSYNWLGEDPGYTVPSTNGATGTTNVGPNPQNTGPSDVGNPTGKKAIWSTITANLTVPADGRVAVTAGGIATAALGTGVYEVTIPPATVLTYSAGPPLIQPYFWAFEYVP
jgi:hypothetical protein